MWTLTRNRGEELTDQKRFTRGTDIAVYIHDRQGPWQRRSNLNTNQPFRRYLARGLHLSVHSRARLSGIAQEFNESYRRTPVYETPAEEFQASVATISRSHSRKPPVSGDEPAAPAAQSGAARACSSERNWGRVQAATAFPKENARIVASVIVLAVGSRRRLVGHR